MQEEPDISKATLLDGRSHSLRRQHIHWQAQGQSLWGAHSDNIALTNNGGIRVQGRGRGQGQSHLKLNAFLCYHNLRSQPICHEICFFVAKQKILSNIWGSRLDLPVSTSEL